MSYGRVDEFSITGMKVCDCDPKNDICKLGRIRTLATSEFTRCGIPGRVEDLDIEKLYYELIFAVGKKYPNESRHETALRYIKNSEIGDNRACAGESKK